VQGSGEDWATIHRRVGLGPYPPDFLG